MIGALVYLRLASLGNLARQKLRRLREPRYLAGGLAIACYGYFLLFGWARGGQGGRAPAGAVGLGVGLLVVPVALVGSALFTWIAPSKRPGLRFSPAEIDFLFPAPMSRRTLVHFSLLSGQGPALLSALLLGLLWSARGFAWGAALRHIAGWWILIATANLHRSGANLAYASMRERGRATGPVQAAAAALALLLAAAAVSSLLQVRGPTLAELSSGPALASYFDLVLGAGALPWILWPIRLVGGPFLAPDGRAFLAALGPALLVVALHYRWILGMEVSFAEGSIVQAERRAEAAAGPRRRLRRRAGGEPFRLRPGGRPETAFLWKNLISISVMNWRLLVVAAALLAQAAAVAFVLGSSGRGEGGPAFLVAVAAAILAFYVLLLGPQVVQQDLRQDLANADLLKSYPLPGWRVVLGELLAPAGMLTAALWILLGAGAAALAASPGRAGAAPELFTAALCAAAVAPLVCALELLVPNAAALWFPGWYRSVRSRSGGFESAGQRLIFALGQMVLIAIALFPAAVTAPLVVFASEWLIGLPRALVLATAAVAAILGGECAVGVWLLGRRFERLDLSAEAGPAA